MSTNIFGMTTVAFLHEIFTILWIGGMSVLLMAILPALKTVFPDKKIRKPVIDQIQRKLSVIALTSITGMIITGLLMTTRLVSLTSIFDFSTNYTAILSIKHILSIIMIVIVIIRRYYIDKLFGMKNPKKETYSFLLLLSNVLLGWIVLFLSAYMVKIGV